VFGETVRMMEAVKKKDAALVNQVTFDLKRYENLTEYG
jgi:hypothetical protein